MQQITLGAANQAGLKVTHTLNDAAGYTNQSYALIQGVLTDTDVTAWDNGDEALLMNLSSNSSGFVVGTGGEMSFTFTDEGVDGANLYLEHLSTTPTAKPAQSKEPSG